MDPQDSDDAQSPLDLPSPPLSKPRKLPLDLPTSLDDRRAPAPIDNGIEVYDAWQGQAQYLTSTIPTQPLIFNLALESPPEDFPEPTFFSFGGQDRLNRMIAAQAAHRHQAKPHTADDAKMAVSSELSEEEKKEGLQAALNMAVSNGDLSRLKALLSGKTRNYLDLNAPDDEGTAPLVYASCFGHVDIVKTLLDAGTNIDSTDRHQWTALTWATANQHDDVAKLLLRRGASPEAKSASGRSAFDFVVPGSNMSEYLNDNGYRIGSVGVADDFYKGYSQDRLEDEMAEREMKRRMQMDSAINLEVDLGNLGFDEQVDSIEEEDDGDDFVWDRCLNDQMFVFQDADLPRILDIVITNMQPQRSPSQKPVPANVIFLAARYAHYHSSPTSLANLLTSAMDRINDVIEIYHLDMTVLAFWMSNATLLLHYLRKDTGLGRASSEFQLQLVELINEIFVLIIRDAERRIDRVLDSAILQHETIELDDVQFKEDWNFFKKNKTKPQETLESRFGPPTPQQRAKIAPRHVTSLLSSTLFVLDLYDVHSLITTQVIAQLYYWLSAELFNRTINNRKYLSRSKAMQIRMNVSVLEEWARANNRQPEHYENGSSSAVGETVADAAKQHLAPPIQLLQWLQIFSSLGENIQSMENTIQQLPRLSPQQLAHAVKYYRNEVGEPGLPKVAMKHLQAMVKQANERRARVSQGPVDQGNGEPAAEEDAAPAHLLLDTALMLPFSLPSSTDMIVTYGAGFGGVDRERARKYIPTLPAEFLQRLDAAGGLMPRRQYGSDHGTEDEQDDDNDEAS